MEVEPSPVVDGVGGILGAEVGGLRDAVGSGAHGDFHPGEQARVAAGRILEVAWATLQSSCCHIW